MIRHNRDFDSKDHSSSYQIPGIQVLTPESGDGQADGAICKVGRLPKHGRGSIPMLSRSGRHSGSRRGTVFCRAITTCDDETRRRR